MSQVTEPVANEIVTAAPVPMPPLREFWHYFKRNKGAVTGLAYIIIMLVIAIGANVIAPHAPAEQFRDALLRLQKGQVSGPVHSSFGWHLIQLLDTRKVDKTDPLVHLGDVAG